jgi:hypothetical protein
MTLQGRYEYMKTVFRSMTPYSLVHAGNRFQGNGTAIPDTGTYGFRAVYMFVSSHEGIEGEQTYGSTHS